MSWAAACKSLNHDLFDVWKAYKTSPDRSAMRLLLSQVKTFAAAWLLLDWVVKLRSAVIKNRQSGVNSYFQSKFSGVDFFDFFIAFFPLNYHFSSHLFNQYQAGEKDT